MTTKGRVFSVVGLLVMAAAMVAVNIAAIRVSRADSAATAAAADTSAAGRPATGQDPAKSPTQGPAAGESAEPSQQPTQEPPVTYAGRVDGGAAALAIAVRDGQGVAYLCNGRQLEAWLQGPVGDGRLALTNPAGASLAGSHDRAVATGSVTVAGRTYAFRIPLVQAPAGLYRIADKVANAAAQGGWIVYEGGQTGALTLDGVTSDAPPLNPATGEVEIAGVRVRPPRL